MQILVIFANVSKKMKKFQISVVYNLPTFCRARGKIATKVHNIIFVCLIKQKAHQNVSTNRGVVKQEKHAVASYSIKEIHCLGIVLKCDNKVAL